MKKAVLIAAASLACVAAFAQGRIGFVNDSLHLVYYNTDPARGGAFAGQEVSSAKLPPGINLLADLYVGTSSSSLTLMTSTTFSTFGKWNSVNVSVPGIPGGTSVFVVAQIRDSGHAAEPTWTPQTDYSTQYSWYGASPEFTFILGTSTLLYPAMYNHAATQGGAQSTWPDGTYNMDFLATGQRGSIVVSSVPEPTSFALAGLGAAAMLIFRRRK